MSLPEETPPINLDLDHTSRENFDEILGYFPEGTIRENVKAKIELLIATASKKEISEDEERGRKEVYQSFVSWYKKNVLDKLASRDDQRDEPNPVKRGILDFLVTIRGENQFGIPTPELRAIENISDRIWGDMPKVPEMNELLAESKRENRDVEDDVP